MNTINTYSTSLLNLAQSQRARVSPLIGRIAIGTTALVSASLETLAASLLLLASLPLVLANQTQLIQRQWNYTWACTQAVREAASRLFNPTLSTTSCLSNRVSKIHPALFAGALVTGVALVAIGISLTSSRNLPEATLINNPSSLTLSEVVLIDKLPSLTLPAITMKDVRAVATVLFTTLAIMQKAHIII